jgi:hypothetical protein
VYCVCYDCSNALQTFPYYHSAPCPSAFRHIYEMLYHTTSLQLISTLIELLFLQALFLRDFMATLGILG